MSGEKPPSSDPPEGAPAPGPPKNNAGEESADANKDQSAPLKSM